MRTYEISFNGNKAETWTHADAIADIGGDPTIGPTFNRTEALLMAAISVGSSIHFGETVVRCVEG